MAGRIPAVPGGKAYASAKRWDRHSPEWLGINVQVDDVELVSSEAGALLFFCFCSVSIVP